MAVQVFNNTRQINFFTNDKNEPAPKLNGVKQKGVNRGKQEIQMEKRT